MALKFWFAGAQTCTICSAGTFASNLASSSCSTCTIEQPYSQPDRSACSAFCPPGFRVLLPHDCEPCGPGTYSNDHSTWCKNCPYGLYSEKINGSTACGTCASGTYPAELVGCPSMEKCGGYCPNCSAGTYSIGGTNSLACTICTAGKNSLEGASACSACAPARVGICSFCDPGFFPILVDTENKGCTACMKGKYFDTYGSTACIDCKQGKFSSVTNATVCYDCTLRCPGPNFNMITECSASQDLRCVQFQVELSTDAKRAMLIAPLLIIITIYLFITRMPRECIPKVLQPLKPGEGGWKKFKESKFFEANMCNSLKAALFTLFFSSMDFLSNMQLVILLYPQAPYGIFYVQCGSIGISWLLDIFICCWKPGAPQGATGASSKALCLGRMSLLWVYILECQELDPAWQLLEGGFENKKIIFLIKCFKVAKTFVNTIPSYYVQVNRIILSSCSFHKWFIPAWNYLCALPCRSRLR